MDKKQKVDTKKVDTKEFDFPETHFIRDIENRVFQGIVLQCLSEIKGISLIEGNFIGSLLSLGSNDHVKGITAEQDNKNHTVNIKVEVNITYGIPIPEKAEEIQTKVTEEIIKLTGLHVACVHVVFKNIVPIEAKGGAPLNPPTHIGAPLGEEYTDEF